MKLLKTLLALMLALILVASLIACDVAETEDPSATDPTGSETAKPTDSANDGANTDDDDNNDDNDDATDSWKDKTVEEIIAMNVANFKKATSYIVDMEITNVSENETHNSTNKILVTGIDPEDLTDMTNLKATVDNSWPTGSTTVIFDGTTAYSKTYNDYSKTEEKLKLPMTPLEFYEQSLKYMADEAPEVPTVPHMPLLCIEDLPSAFGKAEKIVGEDGKVVISLTEIKEDQTIVEAYVENVKQELDFERAFAKLYLDDNGNIVKLELSIKYSFDPNKGTASEGTKLTVSDMVELIDIVINPEDTVSAPTDADTYQVFTPEGPGNTGGGNSDSFGSEYDEAVPGGSTDNDIVQGGVIGDGDNSGATKETMNT